MQTYRPDQGMGGGGDGRMSTLQRQNSKMAQDQITGWITWYDLKPNVGLELYSRPLTGQLTQTPAQRYR